MRQFPRTQWPSSLEQQFAGDIRLIASPHRGLAGPHVVVAFHFDDERERLGYWVPVDPARRYYLPQRFGAYVYRSANPCVALVIEPRPAERRLEAVQVAFEWMDGVKVGDLDAQAYRRWRGVHPVDRELVQPVVVPQRHVSRKDFEIPLDRWVRAAAAPITLEVLGRDPETGNKLGYYAFERDRSLVEELAQAVRIFEDTPSNRRREMRSGDLDSVVRAYRAEMDRARREGNRARPQLAVAKELGLPIWTAKRRIDQARRECRLGPATGTRAGEGPII